MVRRWKLPAHAGFARALVALTFGLSVTDFASAQAPPPNPDASPLTIDVQDDPALSPRRDLPQGSGATIVGTLEDGVGSQGSAVSGNTVVSSPNLTPTLLSQTASSVTVITAEQIQQRGQINVGEVLRSVPGIDVVRNSTPGSPTTIFIRGAGGEHTKVLVDGIPMNDPISPGRVFDFSNLSVDNIEKIEVIRGPQSVLYGSDAIGGVILITTKKGAGPMQGRASVMGGSFSTMNSAANVSGSRGAVYYSVGGSYLDTNGFSAASRSLPGNVEDDGFMLGTYSQRIGWQPSDNANLDFVFRYNQGNVDIDKGGGAFRDDPNDSNTLQQAVAGVRFHTVSDAGWYEQTLSYYISDVKRGTRSPEDPVPVFPGSFFGNFRGNTQQIDWRNTFHLLDNDLFGDSFTFGGLYQTETGASDTVFDLGGGLTFPSTFPKSSLDDGAVYGENQFRVGESWYTTVGVRSDHFNLYGANDTYRVTSLYRVPGLLTGFRATLGTGFRAPSLYQRFDPFAGNPNLLPEDSKGWDAGIEQPMFDGFLVPSVTYFRNDFTNFIDYDQNLGIYYNAAYARMSGVEFSTLFVLDDRTTMTTSYTYLDTESPSNAVPPPIGTPAQLLRRPRHKLNVQFNRRVLRDRGDLYVGMYYVGDRDDAIGFPSTRVVLQDYVVVNTALTYDLSRNFQVFGRIDNAFNEHYEEVSGFGVAPFSVFAGTTVRW